MTTFNFSNYRFPSFTATTPEPPAAPMYQTVEIEQETSWGVAIKGEIRSVPVGGQITIRVKKPLPTLGQVAYECHSERVRIQAANIFGASSVLTASAYPAWRDLQPETREGWESTASAVSDAIDERADL